MLPKTEGLDVGWGALISYFIFFINTEILALITKFLDFCLNLKF